MNKILYYPNINIEDSIWLRNALLYWDKVSSIMPYDNSEYSLSSQVRYIMGTDYFEPTRPDELMFSDFYNDFIDELQLRVDEFDLRKTRGYKTRVHRSKIETMQRDSLLHHTKISSAVLPILKKKMDIDRAEGGNWYIMNESLADLYMSVLAKYLAVIDQDDTVIGTDRYQYQNYAYKRRAFSTRFDNCKTFLDLRCSGLPTPNMDIPLSDILNFKEKRKNELLRFRLLMKEKERQLKSCESVVEMKDKINTFQDEIALGLSDLERVMKDSNWKTRATVYGTLISVSVPNIIEVAEMFGSHIPLTYKGVAIASGVALGGALAMKEIGNMRQEAIANSQFAYVYHAKHKSIIR
ncbi:hypothetical protein EDC19_0426 [Natranaerovirga hydrolytica]|uniref:Uncharacterized protein n=1 Tax=Natranaerovirga hydrolytica TaxID=680378 RepID=A0A4R1MZI2_9FIRM|nr:DUF6236 family protein [Natranaerovirga hydrolytica]TCK98020.1 hypothetical protein EDC19_0426 [Natranaerovirga hydrolytica]